MKNSRRWDRQDGHIKWGDGNNSGTNFSGLSIHSDVHLQSKWDIFSRGKWPLNGTRVDIPNIKGIGFNDKKSEVFKRAGVNIQE